MDTTLATALQAPTICPVFLVRLDMPGRTVRLCDGSAEIAFDGGTFTGSDAVYGALSEISAPKDAIATEEGGLTIGLVGITEAALTVMETAHRPDVRLWLGHVNLSTGVLDGTPELLFVGEVETSDETVSDQTQAVALNVVSIWHKLLSNNDGHALNNTWHTFAWPGELGLQYTQGLVTAQPSRFAQTQTTTVNAGRWTGMINRLLEQQQ